MPLISVSELTPRQLDYAVAKAERDDLAALNIQYPEHAEYHLRIHPSTNVEQAFPIIEREVIRWNKDGDVFYAWIGGHRYIDPLHEPMIEAMAPIRWDAFQYGQTLLIAAMRAFVESKLGKKVEIPLSLIQEPQ